MKELIDKAEAMFLVREKCLEIINRCADRYYDVDVEDYKYYNMDIFNAIIACKEEIWNALNDMPAFIIEDPEDECRYES